MRLGRVSYKPQTWGARLTRADSRPRPLACTYPAHAWRPKSWKLRRSRRRLRRVGDGLAKKTGEEGGDRGRRGARGAGGSGRNASSSAAAAAAGKAASCSSGMRPRPCGHAMTARGAGRPRLGGRWEAALPVPRGPRRPAAQSWGPRAPPLQAASALPASRWGRPWGGAGLGRSHPKGPPQLPQPPEASLQTPEVPPWC